MEVIVDGIIYQLQSNGGISRLFSEILPRMCVIDDSLHLILLTQGQLKQPLPVHPHITHRCVPRLELYLRLGRLWKSILPIAENLVLKLCSGLAGKTVWHSTYYTLPEEWNGFSIVTVADMIYERFSDLFNRPSDEQFREQKRHCIQQADAVICISETTRQDVEDFYNLDSKPIYVVPLACSDVFGALEQHQETYQMPNRQPFLLYVGLRVHYKNFDKLIQAYSVWSPRKDVALVVVGKSWSFDEEKRLVELGIQDRVHLLTKVDDETLCYLYNQAVAFIYPSLYEGFGIPLLEAMACGCPIVASRIPSTIEVAGECPIYFEPAEVDDLLNAFDVALSEGRNSRRIQMGLKRVKSYSWDKTAALTLGAYRRISSGGAT